MRDSPFNVLFLCNGNSARSIMAEAILNKVGAGTFVAYSAGSHPKGAPHPEALRLLRWLGYDIRSLRPKSWHEFAGPGAPSFDFIFTVCDNAAGDACPVWAGDPITAHWSIPDPAEATGSEMQIAKAFASAYLRLDRLITQFASMPIESLDLASLQEQLLRIERSGVEALARY